MPFFSNHPANRKILNCNLAESESVAEIRFWMNRDNNVVYLAENRMGHLVIEYFEVCDLGR